MEQSGPMYKGLSVPPCGRVGPLLHKPVRVC